MRASIRTLALAFALLLQLGCTRHDTPNATTPAGNGSTSRCVADLTAIRLRRDGPQPCANDSECTVWHNGTYWDGCPREVNRSNGALLDAMRASYEAAQCPAETNGNCAASVVRGCINHVCGGF